MIIETKRLILREYTFDDFDDFILKYGNSLVDDWEIESANETHYMIFNLKKLVEE